MVDLERRLAKTVARLWHPLCLGTIAGLLVYQLSKPWLSWHFDSLLGVPDTASLLALTPLLAMALVLWWFFLKDRPSVRTSIVVSLLTLSLGWGCVLVQKLGGREPQTIFHLGWYEAGQTVAELGVIRTVSGWNTSMMPEADQAFHLPESWVGLARKLNLSSFVAGPWGRLDPHHNNRMNLHPPIYAIVLGTWLTWVGISGMSAIFLGLVTKCLLLALVVVLAAQTLPREDLKRLAPPLLLLYATLPPIYQQIEPQNHELAALLSGIGIWMGMRSEGETLRDHGRDGLLSGLFLGIGALTSFFQLTLFPAIFMTQMVLGRSCDRKRLVWVSAGYGLACGLLVALGYYPWLTVYSSVKLVQEYHTHHPVDTATAILEHLYLGVPAWLFLAVGVTGLWQASRHFVLWALPPVISLAASLYFSFGTITGQRYSAVFLFLMVPLVVNAVRKLPIDRHHWWAIPVSNVLFVVATVFL